MRKERIKYDVIALKLVNKNLTKKRYLAGNIQYVDLTLVHRAFEGKIPYPFLRILIYFIFIVGLLIRLIGYRDKIVCIQNEHVITAFPSILIKHFLRPQTIFIWDDLNLYHIRFSNFARTVIKILETFTIFHTDLLVTGSQYTLDFLKRIGMFHKTIYLPNGVFESTDHPRKRADSNGAIFVGSMNFYQNRIAVKNILESAEALAHNGVNFKITIVGGPLSSIRTSLTHPLANRNVFFTGFLSEEELIEKYEKSLVGLLPYFEDTPRWGGQMTKALNYFLHGLLVVSGHEGIAGIRGLQEGYHYIKVNSTEHLSKTLLEVLNKPDKYEIISKNGRSFILSNFSWEKITGPYIAKIKKLLETAEHAN